jgi:membrane-associated phospholipid phosphatase
VRRILIPCSRVVDHRHSPADVTAGALIGIFAAIVFFLRHALASGTQERLAEEAVNGKPTEAMAAAGSNLFAVSTL